HHPRAWPLRDTRPPMFDSRARRPRPGRSVSHPGPGRHALLFGDRQRLDDDRPPADHGDPVAARVLRRLFDRDDVPRDRAHPERRLPPIRQRVRRELLVNATPPETRIAILEDGRTVEVLHERRGRQGLVGNVYLGRVHRVLPGMQAAFVSIGLERDAFLYVEDVLPRTVDFESDGEENGDGEGSGDRADRPRIDDLVKEGQEFIVQVTKDPLAGKGPRVTANISLPGRTLVYLPGVRDIGISR